jgi:arginine decarboxylase
MLIFNGYLVNLIYKGVLMLAKSFSIVTGHGVGNTELDAFDAALLNAGIGNMNLVKVSSIIPPHCIFRPNFKFQEGQLVYIAYVDKISGTTGENIAAAIGVARPKDLSLAGLIMEYCGSGTCKSAEAVVKGMCISGMKRRSITEYDIQLYSTETEVGDNYSCAFGGVVLWEF